MSYFTGKQRLRIGLGGFLSLIGFLVFILTFLVVTETVNEDVLPSGFLIGVMAVIGILDVVAGVILLRSG
ncbi:hypothetical protein E3J49_05160 [Candidatus Bathyarchaeota archaeon]|nr:MAG: hypothetical protein E3J49_05160 [Candidatus Bathyarchaeota archaeon]